MGKIINIVESIALIAFGIAVICISVSLLDIDNIALSAYLFPFVIGVFITVFSLALLFSARKTTNCDTRTMTTNRSRVFSCLLLVANCLLYVKLMDWLTSLPATAIFIASTTFLLGERSWWKILALAVVGSSLIFAAFKYGLSVYLP